MKLRHEFLEFTFYITPQIKPDHIPPTHHPHHSTPPDHHPHRTNHNTSYVIHKNTPCLKMYISTLHQVLRCTSNRITSRHAIALQYYVYFILYYYTLHHYTKSHHITPNLISHQISPYHTKSHHITPYLTTSHQILPYHT